MRLKWNFHSWLGLSVWYQPSILMEKEAYAVISPTQPTLSGRLPARWWFGLKICYSVRLTMPWLMDSILIDEARR